ncbi:MAG: SMP-30/gluconolactonase/LRE family protein [Bacteroidota bacterium]
MKRINTKPWIAGLCLILVQFTNTSAQSLLNGPQKIVVDAKRDRLLASNYFTGDIVQIDSAGKQSYFIKEAGFTDGIEIMGDTIYGVGENRMIRAYNLVSAEPVFSITLPGEAENYLSSITSDSAGHLFISCPLLNEIYRMDIKKRSFWVFAHDNGLNKPNGILLERENKRIVVIDDSPDSKIHAVSLADSTVSELCSTSFYSPDGIIRDRSGSYYAGGYYLDGMYRIDPSFKRIELFYTGTTIVYPTYDRKNDAIIITHFDDNSWERVQIRDREQEKQ